MGICKLCKKEKNIRNSHIIPKFYFRWLKNNSPTGRIRGAKNPNKSMQDGIKKKLFCQDCENKFSKYETYFANKFFYPYIREYLDDKMCDIGKKDYIYYDERLLQFIISIQWRILITNKIDTGNKKFDSILERKSIVWREYLYDERTDTGKGKTHMIFLRNLINANGPKNPDMSPKINQYLLQAVDGTFVQSEKKLFFFSKIGPFAFFTFLIPDNNKKYHNTVIRKKGKISPAQKLMDSRMNNFLFINRPKKVDELFEYSENQRKKIGERLFADKEKTKRSLTYKIAKTDDEFAKYNKNK